jgi:two-component system phosphate regulon response regulator PhoB
VASVLIVDDDPFIRKLVCTTLEDVAGFEPSEAPDGRQALDLAPAQPPALVFLDIDMPGIDGYEVCRRLRAEPDTSQTTIVMLGRRGGGGRAGGRGRGRRPLLTKPFSPLELLRLVHDLGHGGAAG